MSSHKDIGNRTEELLIDQAVFGLDASEETELTALLGDNATAADNPFMETVALIQLGMAAMDQRGTGRMPAELRRKISTNAPRKG